MAAESIHGAASIAAKEDETVLDGSAHSSAPTTAAASYHALARSASLASPSLLLPDELLLTVFDLLPSNHTDVSRAALFGVCRQWRRVAADRALWQRGAVSLRDAMVLVSALGVTSTPADDSREGATMRLAVHVPRDAVAIVAMRQAFTAMLAAVISVTRIVSFDAGGSIKKGVDDIDRARGELLVPFAGSPVLEQLVVHAMPVPHSALRALRKALATTVDTGALVDFEMVGVEEVTRKHFERQARREEKAEKAMIKALRGKKSKVNSGDEEEDDVNGEGEDEDSAHAGEEDPFEFEALFGSEQSRDSDGENDRYNSDTVSARGAEDEDANDDPNAIFDVSDNLKDLQTRQLFRALLLRPGLRRLVVVLPQNVDRVWYFRPGFFSGIPVPSTLEIVKIFALENDWGGIFKGVFSARRFPKLRRLVIGLNGHDHEEIIFGRIPPPGMQELQLGGYGPMELIYPGVKVLTWGRYLPPDMFEPRNFPNIQVLHLPEIDSSQHLRHCKTLFDTTPSLRRIESKMYNKAYDPDSEWADDPAFLKALPCHPKILKVGEEARCVRPTGNTVVLRKERQGRTRIILISKAGDADVVPVRPRPIFVKYGGGTARTEVDGPEDEGTVHVGIRHDSEVDD